MALKKISDDLQKHDSEYGQREHARTKYSRVEQDGDVQDEFVPRNTWQHKFVHFTKEHIKAFLVGLAFITVISVIVLYVASSTLSQRSFFNEENVIVSVTGPDTVGGGERATYTINYDNNNRADLENAELFITYSDNFKVDASSEPEYASDKSSYVDLGKVAGKKDGKIDIYGELHGEEGHVVSIIATLRYIPENSTTTYEASDTKTTTITSSPVSINIRGPEKIVNGDEIDYSITYQNKSSKELHDQKILVEFPEGFRLLSASSAPAYDNVWEIDTIASHSSGTIDIHGTMDGVRDEVKRTEVIMGTGPNGDMTIFAKAEDVLRIIGSPLTVQQTVNVEKNIASIEEQLDYKITYRNDGEIGLRNVILALKIDSDIVNIEKIDLASGTLDPNKDVITWKVVDIPALAYLEQGDAGSVTFTLPLYNPAPINDKHDKDFIVRTIAHIDSPDIQTPIDRNKLIASNTLVVKVDAPLQLTTENYYKESTLQGYGPMPPVVQEETVYTIVWTIQRPLNDVQDAIVESALPTGVEWKDIIEPKDESLSFNQRTQKIVWNVGRIEAAAGASDSARSVQFQVGLTPSLDQVHTAPMLLNESIGSAVDLFTGRKLEAHTRSVSTRVQDQNMDDILRIGTVLEK